MAFFFVLAAAGYLLREYLKAPLLPVFWLVAVLAAPVFEELLFRGLLLGGLARSRMGVWPALGLTALGFAALHLASDSYAFYAILVSGFLYGAARLATRSTYLAMGLHAAHNFVAVTHVALYLYALS